MRPIDLIAVTGSERPYVFDLPHLLSLPDGFEYRFRYRHRWIDSGIADAPKAYVGSSVLILFHSAQTGRLLPLRQAAITSIDCMGPLILVKFRVGPFISVDLDLAGYEEEGQPAFATHSQQGSAIDQWPSIFVARVPIQVTRNWPRLSWSGAKAIIGLLIFLVGPEHVTEDIAPIVRACGLFVAFAAFGQGSLERLGPAVWRLTKGGN